MSMNKTVKLYEQDAYIRRFSATVQEARETKEGYEIILDQTAFYPEGGGQSGDQGFLYLTDLTNSTDHMKIEVFDTKEKEGLILHKTKREIPSGAVVFGEINWERRFDHMQNHSGEHIVSGLINGTYGYNNVGFHMGSDMITIDFDGELSAQQMYEIEKKANEVVWANRKTQIVIYDEEAVKSVEYRSKKELHGMVRIVTFPDADTCACCGTHVAYTGEIGLIKLISIQKFRSGVRIEMLCGRKALEYVDRICEQNRQVSVALSAKPMETGAAVLRMKDAAAKDTFRMIALENEIFAKKAEECKEAGDVVLFEDEMSPDSLRKLTVAVMEACKGRCMIFAGNDDNGYKYAIGEENGDLRALVKELNQTLNGRGGGKPFFVQGSLNATRADIETWSEANRR